MMTRDQLTALRQKNERTTTHGWPRQTIQELLDTVDAIKKEKKKWQRLAEDRSERLVRIEQIVRPVVGEEK
jgi:uncharacterized iron-regulated membrane protein